MSKLKNSNGLCVSFQLEAAETMDGLNTDGVALEPVAGI